MAAKGKSYERFDSYLLLKKLESDPLSSLWRAASIEGGSLGPILALRRFEGGNRAALVESALTARAIVPLLSGASFVKNQTIDVSAGGVPYLTHEYGGGRSLRQIIDKARGGGTTPANPIPIDLALVVAERVALSLETTSNLKYQGTRLSHGAVIPQLVWINEDGETQVAGQQLGTGVVASLREPAVAGSLFRYFAPEVISSGEITKASEVYAVGAILYLVTTGAEPPDPSNHIPFEEAIKSARMMNGEPLPDDIRSIVARSLAIDPSGRYGNVVEVRQALSVLVHGGRYSATSFNLAFYLSNLFRKEIESESLERERESKIDVAALLATGTSSSVAMPEETREALSPLSIPPQKSRIGLILALVAAAIILVGAGVLYMRQRSSAPPTQAAAPATGSPRPTSTAPSVAQQLAAQPVVVAAPAVPGSTSAATGTAATASVDPAAQKKAFEDAVSKRLQSEMLKLQSDFNRQHPPAQPATAETTASAAPAPARSPATATRAAQTASLPPAEDRAPSAAALDQQRRTDTQPPRQEAPPTSTMAATQSSAPVLAPSPAPPQQGTREGDVVEIDSVDTIPRPIQPIHPAYPPMAAHQKAQGNVILTAFISETGAVLDVKVLRGAPFGFDEAAMRAVRAARFTPATKDGKRVRTWMPIPINFTLQ
jgi:protein TonB